MEDDGNHGLPRARDAFPPSTRASHPRAVSEQPPARTRACSQTHRHTHCHAQVLQYDTGEYYTEDSDVFFGPELADMNINRVLRAMVEHGRASVRMRRLRVVVFSCIRCACKLHVESCTQD
jgi:hypothetical protein